MFFLGLSFGELVALRKKRVKHLNSQLSFTTGSSCFATSPTRGDDYDSDSDCDEVELVDEDTDDDMPPLMRDEASPKRNIVVHTRETPYLLRNSGAPKKSN